MRTMTRTALSVATASAALLLTGGMATAQDADLQVQVEDLQQRYEEAVAAGDWEGLAALYTETPIYSPVTGGLIEDREGIGRFYEQSGVTALDLRSSRTAQVGENLVLDIGTFTATMPGEGGEMEMEGEYTALSEMGVDGLQLRSATVFPAREAPAEPQN